MTISIELVIHALEFGKYCALWPAQLLFSSSATAMASPHRLARSPSSASRAAPAFSTANFVRSLRKAASFGYRKPSAGVADSADTTRRRSADTVVMSPCRSSPEPGFAARGAWDQQTRRRRSTGQSSPSEGAGRGPSVPRKTPATPKEDVAHRARVLTARLMQWRLANARMEKAMTRATHAAEVSHADACMQFLYITTTTCNH